MRHAMLFVIALTGLCNACAAKETPAPQIVVAPAASVCPAPARPALPFLDSDLPLEGPENIGALMERDDILRQYIHGLESTVECYRAQTTEK